MSPSSSFCHAATCLETGWARVRGSRTAPIPIGRFLRYAAAGAMLWAGIWITLGYLCADVIDVALAYAARVKVPLITVLAVALFVYAGQSTPDGSTSCVIS